MRQVMSPLLSAVLGLAHPSALMAGETYVLTSASETRAYGLLLTAPDQGCGRVRYQVASDNGVLGHTPPLAPGEGAVVRMGRGFSPGDHVLVITAAGCRAAPPRAHRVTLAKSSPDHGWRWPQ